MSAGWIVAAIAAITVVAIVYEVVERRVDRRCVNGQDST